MALLTPSCQYVSWGASPTTDGKIKVQCISHLYGNGAKYSSVMIMAVEKGRASTRGPFATHQDEVRAGVRVRICFTAVLSSRWMETDEMGEKGEGKEPSCLGYGLRALVRVDSCTFFKVELRDAQGKRCWGALSYWCL